jgi:hypothetical protein
MPSKPFSSLISSYRVYSLASVANRKHILGMFILSGSAWSSMLPDKVVSGYWIYGLNNPRMRDR